MDRWHNKIAVVTGASAGIGASLCRRLVHEGLQVVGLARRKKIVEEMSKSLGKAKGKLHALKVDVGQESQVLDAFKWIKSNLGPVHILINNAAVIKPTDLIDGNTEMWKEILNTNILGLCLCTREAIKSMKDNQIDGHIIHMNSVGGHWITQVPQLSVYPSSKFAVTALTETLRREINANELKIKITSVSPGLVDTDAFEANNFYDKDTIREYMTKMPFLKPEDVVEACIYTLSTPAHVNVQEIIIRPMGESI